MAETKPSPACGAPVDAGDDLMAEHEAAIAERDRRIAELEAEVKRCRNLIALDRTGLGAGLDEVRRIATGYGWIPAGEWGSYSCDEQAEETLRREIGDALDAITAAATKALRDSGDRADAAFRPELESTKRLLERSERAEADAAALQRVAVDRFRVLGRWRRIAEAAIRAWRKTKAELDEAREERASDGLAASR